MQSLPAEVAAKLSDEQQVRYILNVADRGHGGNAAHAAKSLVKDGLGNRSNFIDALARRIATDPAGLVSMYTNWPTLGRLIDASGRADVLAALVTAFAGHETVSSNGEDDLFKFAAAHQDPAVSVAGAARVAAVKAMFTRP
jgi:hypothetical protein